MARNRKTSAADYFPDEGLVVSTVTSASAFSGLQQETEKALSSLSRTVDDIPVNQLVRNPFQPRKIFDESRLAELAASIQEYGVLQRIVVRPSPTQEGIFEILAGERRWRACMLVSQPTCPAEILHDCSDEKMRQVALIENVQRVDLTPIELAETYYDLTREGEGGKQLYTIRALAQVIGKDKSHVEDHLKLLKVPPDTRQLIIDDPKISLRIVAEIGSVPDETDRADLIGEVRRRNENGWNTQDVIKIVRALKQPLPSSLHPDSAPSSQDQKPTTDIPEKKEQDQLQQTPATAPPSPRLQFAKFRVAWEKQDQSVQRMIGKVTQERPTYDAEQLQAVQDYLERWSSQLQETIAELRRSVSKPDVEEA